MKKMITDAGEGYLKPNDGSKAEIQLTLRVANNGPVLIDNKTARVTVDSQLMHGLEELLKSMHRGEHCHGQINSKYAYSWRAAEGDEVKADILGDGVTVSVPTKADLEFDLKLLSFEKGRETWEMSHEEKIAHMENLKSQGNQLFKIGCNQRAISTYNRGVKVFSYDGSLNEEQKKQVHALKATLQGNIAAVNLKLKNYSSVISASSEALKCVGLDGTQQLKHLVRRANAQLLSGEFELAESDIKEANQVIEANPDASAEREKLVTEFKRVATEVSNKLRAVKEKERRAFAGFFGKVSLVDDKEASASAASSAEMNDE